ncbi:MAG: TetR/AcrR family transcriptional regulator [Anaerolineae bacterium]|nr:TetR/AcrR family transcriptional regulator [Anaerolineae bacterium]
MVTRRERQREATREEIKTIALKQMARKGTAGLSLRGIAEEMGLTVTALYRYYGSLDDLITALIMDGFDAQADSLQAAVDRNLRNGAGAQLLALMLDYRDWALANPAVFQLLYGNPIPGYEAPAELTVPKAKRGIDIVFSVLMPEFQAGTLRLPPEADPNVIKAALADYPGLDPALLYITIEGRLRMHGLVMLELHGHLEGTVIDPARFYRHECECVIKSVGLPLTEPP